MRPAIVIAPERALQSTYATHRQAFAMQRGAMAARMLSEARIRENTHGSHRCHRTRRRHCRHLGRLHLAKRGLAVALVDRGGVGEGTSYGNAGIIEGNTYFPYPFPTDPAALLRIALKQATGGELSPLASAEDAALAVRLLARRPRPEHMFEFAQCACGRSSRTARRRARSADDGIGRGHAICARTAGCKVYRSDAGFAEHAVRSRRGRARRACHFERLDHRRRARARAGPRAGFRSMRCSGRRAASITNPLAVTRAYAARVSRARRRRAERRCAHAASLGRNAGASIPTRGRSMRRRP